MEDAGFLKDIHTKSVRESCSACYSDDQISAWTGGEAEGFARVVRAAPVCLVYILDSSPVGFISIRGDFSIWHLYVVPEFSRHGIGSALLERIEAWLQKNGVTQSRLESSLNAIAFYEKNGYVQIARKTLIFRGVDIPTVVMEKDLGFERLVPTVNN